MAFADLVTVELWWKKGWVGKPERFELIRGEDSEESGRFEERTSDCSEEDRLNMTHASGWFVRKNTV